MLRLEDRIRVAIGSGTGIQLSPSETLTMAELLVAKTQEGVSAAARLDNVSRVLEKMFK